MLKKKKIQEYVLERFEKIKQFHSEFSRFGRQSDLHQFRVEIKKLRMVIRLLDHCLLQKNASVEFLPLKTVFKEAGEIRNIHIEIGILEKFARKGSGPLHKKKQVLKSKSLDFIRKVSAYEGVIESTENGILQTIEDLDDKGILTYLKGLIHKTGKNLQNSDKKEKMHKARSLMKVLLYNTALSSSKVREALPIDKNYLNELQELIGKWHDADLAHEELRTLKGMSKKALTSVEEETNELDRQVFLMSRDFPDRMYQGIEV